MNRRTAWPALLTTLLMAQGCSGVLTSDRSARQYYLLKPLRTAVPSADGAVLSDLAVDIRAIPGLDTDQILALGADARLLQYSNARWPDFLPEVLTSTIQRSLESTGQFATVRATERASSGGWLLQLEVREFYGIQDTAGDTSSVRVALTGGIDCSGEHHRLDLHDSNPVATQRLASVVAAHQAGLDGVTRELIRRIGQACSAGGPE